MMVSIEMCHIIISDNGYVDGWVVENYDNPESKVNAIYVEVEIESAIGDSMFLIVSQNHTFYYKSRKWRQCYDDVIKSIGIDFSKIGVSDQPIDAQVERVRHLLT